MPATSLAAGESSAAALGERAGRLALEVEQHPAVQGAQHLAEVEVAVDPLHRRPGRSSAASSSNAARSASAYGASSAHLGGGARPAGRACRSASARSSLRSSAPVRQRVGQRRVHLRGRRAEPLRLAGEVTADLVGVQVAPRRSRSRTLVGASSQPSVAPLRNAWAIARLAVDRSPVASVQLPSSQPSGGAMCVLPAAASAACISRSGLSPGETLRNTLRITRVAEDHRGVALLGADDDRRAARSGSSVDRRVAMERQAADRSAVGDAVAASARSRPCRAGAS